MPAYPDREAMIAQCTVNSSTEILFLLRAIQKQNLLVNLDIPGSRQIVVTSIIAINKARNTLILDCARGDALNQELMSGKGAEFITQLEGVSITFATGPVTLCEHENLPALCMAIPQTMIRLQRREHFRVALPIAHPVKCIIPAMAVNNEEPITAHIVDIGCGGIAIVETGGLLGTAPERILPDCRLLLPDADVVITSLEIRNSAQIRLRNGAFQSRLGCKFVNLPNDMATTLQRFVMNIERVRRDIL